MDNTVRALAMDGSGHLYAGGDFGTAGGKVSAIFAHWIDPGVVSIEPLAGLPERLALQQNYPNPFNPSTMIRFTLSEASSVRLVVYDLMGRAIRTLVDQYLMAGEQQAAWDGRDASGQMVSSGVYMYRIETGGFVQARHMTLVK